MGRSFAYAWYHAQSQRLSKLSRRGTVYRRGQLVELSHRVGAADGDLLVEGRAYDSVHPALADVLAIDAPDDSPRRVDQLIYARLRRETVEDRAIVELAPQQQDIGPHRLVVDPITRNRVDQFFQGLLVHDKHLD